MDGEFPTSHVVAREPCPECGSRDNVRLYDDGHRYCFGAGCSYRTKADNTQKTERKPKISKMIDGEFRSIPKRGLGIETCRKFGIRVGRLGEKAAVAMDYRDQDGNIVAQKVRLPDEDGKKTFTVLGDLKKAGLFGQHLWSSGGRQVVVTEGEFDAAAMCQAQDLKWPVVSIQNGAASAAKSLAASRQWLEGFEKVVLMFDADDAGRIAVAEGAAVLTPGKVFVADLGPLGVKDANEAVLKGEEAALVKAMFNARPWRPDGVVSLSDIRAKALAPVEMGRPWPWQELTAATYGRRIGDVIGFGAGTGAGKTDLFTGLIAHDVNMGVRCGVLALEQDVGDTGKRLAGKMAGKMFHLPNGSWTQEELEATWNALERTDNVRFFDNFGAMDWKTVRARIQYMHEVEGCEHIFLDHLTALAAAEDDERKSLEKIMAQAAADAKGRYVLHYISHLATPEGGSHEEGARVQAKHFKGSRAIQFWSHFMFGIERNQQADDPEERCVMTLRCLKDRNSGQATGKTFRLRYDRETGLLSSLGELKVDVVAQFDDDDKLPF